MTQDEKVWADLAVGDTVWYYVEDSRRIPGYYDQPSNRSNYPYVPYRSHWLEAVVESETKLSWVINGKKYPKRTRPNEPLLISEQEVDDTVFVYANSRALSDKIKYGISDHAWATPLRDFLKALESVGVKV